MLQATHAAGNAGCEGLVCIAAATDASSGERRERSQHSQKESDNAMKRTTPAQHSFALPHSFSSAVLHLRSACCAECFRVACVVAHLHAQPRRGSSLALRKMFKKLNTGLYYDIKLGIIDAARAYERGSCQCSLSRCRAVTGTGHMLGRGPRGVRPTVRPGVPKPGLMARA